ncbi:unnamed protein product [Paramecium pentaurelia]|uniref:Uncharacterized protein n=1 Tax=Paramecium pentaurelia TaxID=43138 RepID=A0A8S1UJS4_9CILI|nr:unnamed protein product [Paramecium pentaurelia]
MCQTQILKIKHFQFLNNQQTYYLFIRTFYTIINNIETIKQQKGLNYLTENFIAILIKLIFKQSIILVIYNLFEESLEQTKNIKYIENFSDIQFLDICQIVYLSQDYQKIHQKNKRFLSSKRVLSKQKNLKKSHLVHLISVLYVTKNLEQKNQLPNINVKESIHFIKFVFQNGQKCQ